MWPRNAPLVGLLCICLGLGAVGSVAQEFEPRTYSIAPPGVNFIAIAYGYSSGNVFLDPALPIEGLDGNVHLMMARYTRTLQIFGQSAKIKLAMPWSSGEWQGLVEGEPGLRNDQGMGDSRVKLELNFARGADLDPQDRRRRESKTIVGTSLQVVVPTGDYDNTELINLGSNRWTFRPESGLSYAVNRKWTLEAGVSAWLFTDNTGFLEGLTLSQDVLYVAKFHAIRAIRPGFWWALGAGWGDGGRTSVDGVPRQTIQKNWRFGGTIAYPVTPRQGVILALNSGHTRKAGNDFDSVAVSYQFAWGNT